MKKKTVFFLVLLTLLVLIEGIANAQTYVDLGLPSGTLWADRNVGAASPEDCGDYFAWGETTSKSITIGQPTSVLMAITKRSSNLFAQFGADNYSPSSSIHVRPAAA